jgi:hypothetical protein
MFGNDKEEVSSSEKSIENELIQDLRASEEDDQQNSNGTPDIIKPVLNLEHHTVKSAYKIKKRIQLAIHSKDVPLSIKPKLSHLSEVTDNEAEVVKRVLDRYGSDNLRPEWIELLNKYINTPLWPLLEMEWALNEKMKADIAMICEGAKS